MWFVCQSAVLQKIYLQKYKVRFSLLHTHCKLFTNHAKIFKFHVHHFKYNIFTNNYNWKTFHERNEMKKNHVSRPHYCFLSIQTFAHHKFWLFCPKKSTWKKKTFRYLRIASGNLNKIDKFSHFPTLALV